MPEIANPTAGRDRDPVVEPAAVKGKLPATGPGRARRSGAAVPELSARERILRTAEALFSRDGVRAVGVDLVVAQAGVAKMSLYRSFPSKEDLVVAYLERRNERYWTMWDEVTATAPGDPGRQILAFLDALTTRIADPRFTGCAFLHTAVEFPEAGNRGHAVALRHKQELRARLRDLTGRMAAREPDLLADQLTLLIDGVYASVSTLGPSGPAACLCRTAEILIAAQAPADPAPGSAPGSAPGPVDDSALSAPSA